MLELHAVGKVLPTSPPMPPRVLFDELDFALAAGECVAIIGESGSGKSSLLNCIAGLDRIDQGRIVLAGERIDALDDDQLALIRRHQLGFVFQAFHILPHLNVLDNVALPLWLLRVDEAAAAVEARAMLAAVGLGSRAEDAPHNLSGGELQRVAIARALAHRPQLVLADEPTGNLDPLHAAEVLDLLLAQVRVRQAACVLVTHSQRAAARADRVLELVDGRLRRC